MDWKTQLTAWQRGQAKAAEEVAPESVSLSLAELDALDSCRCLERRQTVKVLGVDGPLAYSDHYCTRTGPGVTTVYATVDPKPVPSGHWATMEVKAGDERVRFSGSYESLAAMVFDAIWMGAKARHSLRAA